MKQTLFILLGIIVCGTISAADLRMPSRATDVTIFLSGAQVTRTSEFTLPSGQTSVRISNLSPYINDNSIQVSIDGNVTILGVKHEYNYSQVNAVSAQAESIKKQIEGVDIELENVKAQIEVAKAEQEFLLVNQTVGGQNTGTNLTSLKETLTFFSERMQSAKDKVNSLTREQKQLTDKRTALNKELNKIQTSESSTMMSDIVVNVAANKATKCTLTISYYVRQASWMPSYDIRAKGVGEPIQLFYKANIYQSSLENWSDVNLTLSSMNPQISNTLPILPTYYLNEPERALYGAARSSNKAYALSAVATQETVMEEEADMVVQSLAAGVVTSENMASFQMKLPIAYTIPSSRQTSTTAEVGVFELPAEYTYYSVPKMDTDAFLMARLTGWHALNLLAGEANVYALNTFVGSTYIDPSTTQDTLMVSLGRDPNIVIKRDIEHQYANQRMLSKQREVARGWTITAKNGKSKAINLVLTDQIPVSTTSNVEITAEQLSGAEHNASTGKLTWRMTLNPGEEKQMTLKYKVRYPKDWANYNVQ